MNNTTLFFLFSLFLFQAEVSIAHEGPGAHLDHINEALEKTPDKQSLYIERGAIYSSEAGLHELALKDFQRAEKLGPPVAVAYELGLLFYRSAEFSKSRMYFDRYISQFPDYAPAYEYRAKASYQIGDTRQAMADFNAFFRLQKQINPGSFIAAAKIYASAKEGGVDAAIALLDQGIKRIGLNPQLQSYAARLELQRNRPEQAIARHQTMRTMLNDSPAWKAEMAELLLDAGKPAEAAAFLDQAEEQLAKLKATPARLNLLQTIQKLRRQAVSD